jgi:hypothetical protein
MLDRLKSPVSSLVGLAFILVGGWEMWKEKRFAHGAAWMVAGTALFMAKDVNWKEWKDWLKVELGASKIAAIFAFCLIAILRVGGGIGTPDMLALMSFPGALLVGRFAIGGSQSPNTPFVDPNQRNNIPPPPPPPPVDGNQ